MNKKLLSILCATAILPGLGGCNGGDKVTTSLTRPSVSSNPPSSSLPSSFSSSSSSTVPSPVLGNVYDFISIPGLTAATTTFPLLDFTTSEGTEFTLVQGAYNVSQAPDHLATTHIKMYGNGVDKISYLTPKKIYAKISSIKVTGTAWSLADAVYLESSLDEGTTWSGQIPFSYFTDLINPTTVELSLPAPLKNAMIRLATDKSGIKSRPLLTRLEIIS